MSMSRLDIRLSSEIKLKAERASSLLGLRSLTEYIVKLLEENSTKVIETYENMALKDDVFDNFINACNEVKPPNQNLIDAFNFSISKGMK